MVTTKVIPRLPRNGIRACTSIHQMSRAFYKAPIVVACLALPTSASAFSDPQAYADPADVGGGAGRWFTGSSADGYGCNVCHTGNAGEALEVSGLPVEGFVGGKSYEVSVRWPASALHFALIAEFTDEQRRGAGAIALPRPDALKPAELCGAELAGQFAAQLHDAEGGRQLVSVIDCGARILRFQWTPPPSAAGPLAFDVGFVSSNQDAAPSGDGVTLVRRVLPRAGNPLETRIVAQGCTAVQSKTAQDWLMPLLLLAVAARRRTRNRREES
jgi:MYXO-CTERM domain-containing protein